MLEIKTLGGLSIRLDGHEIKALKSNKAKALLIYLLVEGSLQQRSILSALFWPENTQQEASRSLRVVLSSLRKHLGDYFDITRDAVSINNSARVHLDLTELNRKFSINHIDNALEIYNGEFLEGFSVVDSAAFEDWIRSTSAQIHNQLFECLQDALQEAMLNEEFLNAERYAGQLLKLDPLDEVAHQQMMLLLALTNRKSAALSHYQLCCDILQKELQLEPSEQTRRIYEKIAQGGSLQEVKHQKKIRLPAPQTSFIGREQEIQQLTELLKKPTCRLISIVGQGGIGKTRLSIETAQNCKKYFSDGVFFVPVENCPSLEHLILAIAKSIELTIDVVINASSTKMQLLEYLHKRSCLLILDGFEHLVSHAEFLVELLDHSPKTKLLVNSRQSLEIKSEWIFHLEGLPYNYSEVDPLNYRSDAPKLFLARAQQTNSTIINFEDEQQAAVLQICKIVDGMPLGIELAAAWCDLLQPSEIAREIQINLDFLTANKKDIPQKHQSLRVIFDHTWQAMTDSDKNLFSRLAVFQGEFDLQAAQAILDADLPQLNRLIDRSLLKHDQAGGFFMHALAHQFAAEKLMQHKQLFQETSDRFCNHYVDLLLRNKEALLGANMMQVRDEIKPFLVNIQTAILLVCSKMPKDDFYQLLSAALAFYTVHSWHEGVLFLRQIEDTRRKWLTENNAQNIEMDNLLLTLKLFQAFWLINLGNIEEGGRISAECLPNIQTQEMTEQLSVCLHNLGVAASFRGEYDKAMSFLEEAVLLGKQVGRFFWPTYLFWLGHVYFLKGEYEQGLATLEKSFDIYKQSNTLWGCAFAVSKMGLAEDSLGHHVKALHYQQEGLQTFEQLGYSSGMAYCLSRMSISAFFLGKYKESIDFAQQGYDMSVSLGHSWGICTSLCRLGFAHLGLQQTLLAQEKFTESIQLSIKVKMIPLTLYALLGLACIFIIEGQDQIGQALYNYVRQHPKTP